MYIWLIVHIFWFVVTVIIIQSYPFEKKKKNIWVYVFDINIIVIKKAGDL